LGLPEALIACNSEVLVRSWTVEGFGVGWFGCVLFHATPPVFLFLLKAGLFLFDAAASVILSNAVILCFPVSCFAISMAVRPAPPTRKAVASGPFYTGAQVTLCVSTWEKNDGKQKEKQGSHIGSRKTNSVCNKRCNFKIRALAPRSG
jgi:hypothetical protein